MYTVNPFPLGVAENEAFCNRLKDRHELAEHIQQGNHIVLSAPRRYGKSSLIQKVVKEIKLPYVWIDFLTVASKEEVQAQIAKLVSKAIYAISSDAKKIQLQVKHSLLFNKKCEFFLSDRSSYIS